MFLLVPTEMLTSDSLVHLRNAVIQSKCGMMMRDSMTYSEYCMQTYSVHDT